MNSAAHPAKKCNTPSYGPVAWRMKPANQWYHDLSDPRKPNEAFRLPGAHSRLIRPVEQIFGEQLYRHQFKINAKAAFDGEVGQ
jgi:hypothetical protein